MSRWAIRVDTGGTFTDCLAVDPAGRQHRTKVLSHSALRGRVIDIDARRLRYDASWRVADGFLVGYQFRQLGSDVSTLVTACADGELTLEDALALSPRSAFEVFSGEEAPVLAARLVTGTALHEALPDMELRLATTRGTNALLERKGVPTALFVTAGFTDLLRIGDQQRTDLFALEARGPEPLTQDVVEVDERLDARGQVVRSLQLDGLRERAVQLLERGVRAAAVALLHSTRNPEHEQRVSDLLRDVGFDMVAPSAALAPFIKILPRAQTAVVEACLGPIIDGYLDRVSQHVDGSVYALTSAGGLVPRRQYHAKDSLLSGPAGGVAGAAAAGRASGEPRVLTFDMGGTSTDVARYDGDFDYRFEHRVGDAHLVAPALAIETVAAGGGSICRYAAGRLTVGPESAGADPGPACYGADGPLTVTDVNLLLGRLDADRFGIPIDQDAASVRLAELRAAMAGAGESVTDEQILEGLAQIADERMAAAIRQVSVAQGFDPSEYGLVAFGGAGAQHACGVADCLGIDRVIVPVDASLLSAHGLGAAVIERFAERQILRPLAAVESDVAGWLGELADEAQQRVLEDAGEQPVDIRRRLASLRFAGQDAALTVDVAEGADLSHLFAAAYQSVYGHQPTSDRPIEVESLRVVASTQSPPSPDGDNGPSGPSGGPDQRRVWTAQGWRSVDVWHRQDLRPDEPIDGPALVFEAHSTCWVADGWRLHIDEARALCLRRVQPRLDGLAEGTEAVRLELFTNALENGAREMGTQLQRTALSTNVKERLDFSCALLDPDGHLVVNAPHIPVHLGALGVCVRAVAANLDLSPGDTAVTNHPAFGGSHLPDITVITPVHTEEGQLLGYAASRAHHAEIGGARPGSMPPSATRLIDEGVVIAPRLLVRDGVPCFHEMEALLRSGPYPSRAPADNLADLEAALAANHRGARHLQDLAQVHGASQVNRYMRALRAEAAAGVRGALAALPDGVLQSDSQLDGGPRIAVTITVSGDQARIDFDGTSAVHAGNLNATPAIVQSALVYVLRLLVDRPLPLNEGFLDPVSVRLPEGLLNPVFPGGADDPAVVGGNVETSQRLVEALLRAFDLAADSQGTMNNTLFGNESFGYYETLCGGTGAGPGFDGGHAVHSHMTNTRITDTEVLEDRYPVRVERFAIRHGSGGAGHWSGGDGVIRETTFLQPVSLSVLTQHRSDGPRGAHGGLDGAVGAQHVLAADGTTRRLGAVDGADLVAGDRLLMETPGGGGWGPPGALEQDEGDKR